MKLSKERAGEFFILTEALLWGLYPVVTSIALSKLSLLVALGLSTLFAGIFFGLVISIRHKWSELKQKSALADILITTVILGVIYYVLSFYGLTITSPGNASIIALSEIFFSYLFFHLLRKEDLAGTHIIGAILVVISVFIIFLPSFKSFQTGDIFILLAAMIAPIGNFFQRRARKKVSSESILFIRSFISAGFIISLAFFTKSNFSYLSIMSVLPVLVINGVLVLGLSKLLWIEGIHRISVMKGNALNAISPLFTIILVFVILHKVPSSYQLWSFIPMFLGVIFLSSNKKSREISSEIG